jgi:hypothetical protein
VTQEIYLRPLDGQLSFVDVLNSECTIACWLPHPLPQSGDLLRISDRNFELRLSLRPGMATLSRNGVEISMPLLPKKEGWMAGLCMLVATWTPSTLLLFNGENTQQEVTPVTVVPFTLLQYARKASVVPVTLYNTPEQFHGELLNAVRNLTGKVETSRMHGNVWDYQLEGQRIVSKRPKRETENHHAIHCLLSDIALAKNFEIIPEATSGSGNCDFLMTAPLSDGTSVKCCLEFKNAHSKDIVHGLEVQLPSYMATHATDLGFYVLLWFKGEGFDEPLDTKLQLARRLAPTLYKLGRPWVKILCVDVSFGPPPSRAQHEEPSSEAKSWWALYAESIASHW